MRIHKGSQSSQKSFTNPLLDMSYCFDAAADHTDLLHHNITRVLYQSEDRYQIKLMCITSVSFLF